MKNKVSRKEIQTYVKMLNIIQIQNFKISQKEELLPTGKNFVFVL